jgi:AcrR family transcriptional regulator
VAAGAGTASVAGLDPQLRQPGTELGPRATRTIATILDATRQIFLTKGYAGTTIDDIARMAGVSRASFYTYFPSKRDALLALGANSLSAGNELVKALAALPADWTLDDVAGWVEQYFDLLDEHGSFALAWTQAAHDDHEIFHAGMKGHLSLCRRLGVALSQLGGAPALDSRELGLVTVSTLERGWAYYQLYQGTVDRAALVGTTARMLAAVAVPPAGAPER